MAIHEKVCPNFKERKVQLSCDGVHENKSTLVSIDVYSFTFEHCKHVYPIKLIRPLGSYKIDNNAHLREVVRDILDNDLQIMQYIADKLKRSEAKNCKGHSSWFPCEYCYAKGVKIDINKNDKVRKQIAAQIEAIQEKISDCLSENSRESRSKVEHLVKLKKELQKSLSALKRKSNILWPSSTMNAEHRSRQSIEAIVEKIENEEILTIDESKGIMGRSVLFDIPDFNFTYDSPAEYLHSVCLGLIKRMVELTFSVGSTKRPRNTTRKLSSTVKFNKLLSKTKVTKEFSRRARNLDFSVYKAQEYRNLSLFLFPLIIECIDPPAKERNLWLYLSYVLRAAVIPTEEFSQIDLNVITQCCQIMYEMFEELFGVQNCSYNVHVVLSHFLEIRTHGPLTNTSAFKFESFYGEMRRSFVPGTISPLKQIMKNVLLKKALSNHTCSNSLYISNYDTSLECNKLIYCYKQNEYSIYEVSDINNETKTMSCYKLGKYPASFPETPNLNWSSVGVFRKGGRSSDCTTINASNISGKVVHVGKYLITCPINVLNEK